MTHACMGSGGRCHAERAIDRGSLSPTKGGGRSEPAPALTCEQRCHGRRRRATCAKRRKGGRGVDGGPQKNRRRQSVRATRPAWVASSIGQRRCSSAGEHASSSGDAACMARAAARPRRTNWRERAARRPGRSEVKRRRCMHADGVPGPSLGTMFGHGIGSDRRAAPEHFGWLVEMHDSRSRIRPRPGLKMTCRLTAWLVERGMGVARPHAAAGAGACRIEASPRAYFKIAPARARGSAPRDSPKATCPPSPPGASPIRSKTARRAWA